MNKNKHFLIAFLMLYTSLLFGQEPFTLNQGFSENKNYVATIPYTEIAGKLIINVSINNQNRKFILDTGAATVISENLFKELHPKVLQTVNVSDSSGKTDSLPIVSLSQVTINSISFKDIPAIVSKESKIIFECFGVDGFIGSNLLRNSAIQFDEKTKTITITDKPNLLNLDKKDAGKMELSSSQSDPYVWIKLKNEKGDVATEKILFDTGDDGFYRLSINAYKHIIKDVNVFEVKAKSTGSFTAGIHGSAEDTENYMINIPLMEVNNMKFKNVITKTTYTDASRFGSGILKYGKITLDYINKKFYVQPFQNTYEISLQKQQWPIDPVLNNDKFVVGIIWDQTLSQKIKKGDEIIKFDNMDYQKMNSCDITKSNKEIDKQKAIIELKDAQTGQIKEVELNKY
ncbi:gag-polyprotein putative aspartyl protease [Chryseobacterium taichungense]|uniref:Gag-polyprotein putative aspartyl protease n=1 Tax=Chryseobacterium taichungense TaxID=295069 RepID=A0A1H7VML9_9FLAO|nr:retropepsin-like aspartic protease [Chryseobacterium taichungense]SEM10037.1 gag-polyprotein putative aspartyl protease [Chryseobacterium taichungense]